MTLVLLDGPTIKIERYGWRPQLPDINDFFHEPTLEELSAATDILQSRTEIDLRTSGFMPEPYDQGQLGSCTANSGAANMEFTAGKEGVAIGGTPSRLFIYYNERVAQGTVDVDSGATIRGSLKAMHKYGAPPETEWPYDIQQFRVRPPIADFTDALKDVALKYHRVLPRAENIVASLAAKKPVNIGFTVYESFENDIGSNGIMPWPTPGERVMGGHAVLVVGIRWINDVPYWIVRNSWGPDWADNGYFYMPFSYLLQSSLSSDFWNIEVEGARA